MAESNGSAEENQNSRRLDQMRDVIHSMIDLVQAQSEAWTKRHNEIMAEISATHEEIRDLIILQKEHRIDIMALFQSQKNIRERMEQIDGGNG